MQRLIRHHISEVFELVAQGTDPQGRVVDQARGVESIGGGMMHHTASPSEIVEVVLAELRQIKATVVEDLEVEVSFDTGTSGAGGGGAHVEIEVTAVRQS